MRRLVVVGGGIAGLAAAWTAARSAAVSDGLEVVLLERHIEVGGKALSIARDGWLAEGGPGGFLSDRPAMDRLIEEAGLDGERRAANAAAARRFLFHGGQMREIVQNPVGFARSGILTAGGFARLMAEPFIRRRRGDGDESVWSFAARRLGAQVADRLVMPMALGVFAGDARRLSLPAAFPRMATLEREHGSLIRGMIAKRGHTNSGTLTSFRCGIQSLPRALAERGRFQVRCGCEARALRRTDTGWEVVTTDGAGAITADAVLLAGEPWAIAALLRPHAVDAANQLDAIPCPPVSVVSLGYGGEALRRVPRGFGVLIARGEGYRMLGNLWDAYLFEGRGPAGQVLIRSMFGGAVDPGAGALSDDEIAALARAEIARLYGITAAPVFEQVVRWSRAIPQYEMGHLERVARIERSTASLQGVFVTGNGLRGVAFADAATDGVRQGRAAAAWLGRTTLEPAEAK